MQALRKRIVALIVVIASLALLAGCSSTSTEPDDYAARYKELDSFVQSHINNYNRGIDSGDWTAFSRMFEYPFVLVVGSLRSEPIDTAGELSYVFGSSSTGLESFSLVESQVLLSKSKDSAIAYVTVATTMDVPVLSARGLGIESNWVLTVLLKRNLAGEWKAYSTWDLQPPL